MQVTVGRYDSLMPRGLHHRMSSFQPRCYLARNVSQENCFAEFPLGSKLMFKVIIAN